MRPAWHVPTQLCLLVFWHGQEPPPLPLFDWRLPGDAAILLGDDQLGQTNYEFDDEDEIRWGWINGGAPRIVAANLGLSEDDHSDLGVHVNRQDATADDGDRDGASKGGKSRRSRSPPGPTLPKPPILLPDPRQVTFKILPTRALSYLSHVTLV